MRTSIVSLEVSCKADPRYFEDDIPNDIDAELIANGPIDCEGSGNMGPWCDYCRFGRVEMLDREIV